MILDWYTRERLYARVLVRDPQECWPWTASRTEQGYGKFWTGGRTRGAHRVAWMLANHRVLTRWELVRHTCDNPPCCNPRHLIVGSPGENSQDMVDKGRQCKGEGVNTAKLFEEDVLNIVQWYATGNVSAQEIAEAYGLTKQSVLSLLRKETWKHVERPDLSDLIRQGLSRGGAKRRSEANGNAKLTEEQVREIHRLWAEGVGSRDELAAQFGVAPSMIRRIVKGQFWSHLGLATTEDGRSRRYRRQRRQPAEEAG